MRLRRPKWAIRRHRLRSRELASVDRERTWRVSAASVPGSSHVVSGLGSDDAFAYQLAPDGRSVVIAVADGAGSRSGTSALGSFEACRAVMSDAGRLLAAASSQLAAEAAVRRCFSAARAAIETTAGKHGLTARDLATTLAVAVLTPNATIVGSVGDGIIVCDVDGQPESLIPEEKGEYVNETVFITAVNALERDLRVCFLDKSISRVALSTDGLKYKILRLQEGGGAPFEPFFAAAWTAVADGSLHPAALSEGLSDLDDQTGDDKTLVVGALVDGPVTDSTLPLASASFAPVVPGSVAPQTESTP